MIVVRNKMLNKNACTTYVTNATSEQIKTGLRSRACEVCFAESGPGRLWYHQTVLFRLDTRYFCHCAQHLSLR